jgi:hypothetical protein
LQSRAKIRNAELFKALLEVAKAPNDDAVRERWILAAQDLTRAVFKIQFMSMKNSPDKEDLEQAALLEFHRVAVKLSALTETYTPDSIFRVLYSVAKFSMLRELARLRRHSPGDSEDTDSPKRVEELPQESDPAYPQHPGHYAEIEGHSRARFMANSFPAQVVNEVNRLNLYTKTQWGPSIRFCAFQRLRGKYVSPEFVKTMWKPPDPDLVVTYSDFLARAVIFNVSLAGAHIAP